jgi:AraC-like DNA-binding protein
MSEKDEDFYIGLFYSADLTQKQHSHEFIQIYYIKKGNLEHYMGGTVDMLSMGDLFIVFPGVTHKLEAVKGNEAQYYSIAIMPGFITDFHTPNSLVGDFINYLMISDTIKNELSPYPVRPRISLDGSLQIKAENIVNDMLMEYEKKNEGYYTYLSGLALILLTLIAREYSNIKFYEDIRDKTNYYQSAILSCINYINENFTKDLKLDEVAKKFLLSRTYFCELFKKNVGTTFNKYINMLRIGRAKMLLSNTNMSITDVAFSSGFNDTSNFSRQFAKHINLTPSEYRRTGKIEK